MFSRMGIDQPTYNSLRLLLKKRRSDGYSKELRLSHRSMSVSGASILQLAFSWKENGSKERGGMKQGLSLRENKVALLR